MRSIWRGAISFGLVNIPIKLYTATKEKRIHFRLLHEVCGTPIRYAKMCPSCEEEVEQDDLVRGYELDKGRFVRIEDEDLADLPVESTHTIEILRFVRSEDIDPVYFDRSYYADPAEGGHKSYRLLSEAMEQAGRSALSKVSLRSREQPATLRTHGPGLLLETMHWPDEIRSSNELEGFREASESASVSDKEMQMATALLEQLEGPFEPESYEDEYRKAVERRIAQKVEGNEIEEVAPTRKPQGVVDLMDALEASLKRAGTEENRANGHAKASRSASPADKGSAAGAAVKRGSKTKVKRSKRGAGTGTRSAAGKGSKKQ